MFPVICLVTDRTRLATEEAQIDRVAAAAAAGVHLIQVRERDLEARDLLRLVSRAVAAVASTRARVLVNDRVDVALASGAHGVHLRADSTPAPRVRALAPPGFLIGRSVHSAAEASEATMLGGLDYLIFGPVFPTSSKPDAEAAGPHTLAEVVASTTLPVLAVGGITPERLPEVQRAGAAGIAAIGLFVDCAPEALKTVLTRAIKAFDPAPAAAARHDFDRRC